jgi:hypothetical protein
MIRHRHVCKPCWKHYKQKENDNGNINSPDITCLRRASSSNKQGSTVASVGRSTSHTIVTRLPAAASYQTPREFSLLAATRSSSSLVSVSTVHFSVIAIHNKVKSTADTAIRIRSKVIQTTMLMFHKFTKFAHRRIREERV